MKKYLLLIIIFFGLKNTISAQEVIEVVEDTEEVEETVLESTEDNNNINSLYSNNNTTDIVTGEIENTLLIFKGKNSDKYGLKNKNNKILVKPIFNSINSYGSTRNRIIASLNWDKRGVIDQNGTIIVPFKFSEISKRNNLFIATSNNLKTIFDFYGNKLFQDNYEDFYFIDNGYISVKKNELYGVLNPFGKELIPTEYEYVQYNNSKDWFILKQNDVSIIQKPNGKPVFGKEFTDLQKLDYSFNVIKAKKNGKYGIINSEKEILVPFKFQDINKEYHENTFIVKQKGKWGLYSALINDYVKKTEFDKIRRITSYLYVFEKDNQKYLTDIVSGKKINISNYSRTSNYTSYGLITVEKNNLGGVLDIKTGKLIVPINYSYNDITQYTIKSKLPDSKSYDIFNHKGEKILENITSFKFLKNTRILLTSKGKVGLLDKGKIVMPLEYNFITDYKNFPVIYAKKKDKHVLLNNYDYSYLIEPSDKKITVDAENKVITLNNKKYTVALGKLIEIKK